VSVVLHGRALLTGLNAESGGWQVAKTGASVAGLQLKRTNHTSVL